MRDLLRRLINLLHNRYALPLAPPPLEGLTTTVFVRESNGSRTNLEHHLEQELIARGARVLMANQQAGVQLVKQGEFSPLHPEAHFTFVGTLLIRSGLNQEEEAWEESEFEFETRHELHRVKRDQWLRSLTLHGGGPKPILEPRRKHTIRTPVLQYQLSFRLIGRDGALLVSGTCEHFPHAGLASYESTFRTLAINSIAYLDKTDVWRRIVVA